jgi:hypothetical protein
MMERGTIYIMERGTIYMIDRGTIYVNDCGTIYISPSNYHLIVNIPPNYQLCQCPPPLKLPKNVNVPPSDKNTIHKIIKLKKIIK